MSAIGATARSVRSTARARLGEESLAIARQCWRTGDVDAATRHIEEALNAFETAGLHHRLGEAYKLHAMAFINRDKASLALAAAMRALGYPDIGAGDRAYLYGTIAMAFHQLVDLPTAGTVLLERAWPEALRSGDAKTIVDCGSRCIALLHDYACWASGIENLNTLGVESPPPQDAAAYLAQAHEFEAMCVRRIGALGGDERSFLLIQVAKITALEGGFEAAWPACEAALGAPDLSPRHRMMCELTAGIIARIARKWTIARDLLLKARGRRGMQSDYSRRYIAWELSHVFQALGSPGRAVEELRTFEVLQSRKAKFATEWIADPERAGLYGRRLDLDAARDAMLRPPPLPVSRATTFIEKHLFERLTLDSVSRQAHVGKRTLQKLFRGHLGVSLTQFIRERRMQRADQELRGGLRRVAEVAERCGYSNPANFSRDYRKRFGRSPSSTLRLAGTPGF